MIHQLNINTVDNKTSELCTYLKFKCITITKKRRFSIIVHNRSMSFVSPAEIPPEIQLQDSNVFVVCKHVNPYAIYGNIDLKISIDIKKYLSDFVRNTSSSLIY